MTLRPAGGETRGPTRTLPIFRTAGAAKASGREAGGPIVPAFPHLFRRRLQSVPTPAMLSRTFSEARLGAPDGLS